MKTGPQAVQVLNDEISSNPCAGAVRPMQTRSEKLTRWLIFNVMIALVPLSAGFLGLQLGRHAPSLHVLTARGELLLVSSAIAAAALGELIPAGRARATPKLCAGGSCILLVLLSSLFFAAIQAQHDADPQSVLSMSLWLFAGTLLAGFSCVYLAHEGDA